MNRISLVVVVLLALISVILVMWPDSGQLTDVTQPLDIQKEAAPIAKEAGRIRIARKIEEKEPVADRLPVGGIPYGIDIQDMPPEDPIERLGWMIDRAPGLNPRPGRLGECVDRLLRDNKVNPKGIALQQESRSKLDSLLGVIRQEWLETDREHSKIAKPAFHKALDEGQYQRIQVVTAGPGKIPSAHNLKDEQIRLIRKFGRNNVRYLVGTGGTDECLLLPITRVDNPRLFQLKDRLRSLASEQEGVVRRFLSQ